MAKIAIVYWTGSGNTEKMAEAIAKGAKDKGAEVECKNISSALASDLANFDVIAFGSPAMGSEVIEEGEMEPFFTSAQAFVKGKKVAVFGSYDWGEGEWLETWGTRVKDGGANLVDAGLKVHLEPDAAALAECEAWGAKLAAL